MTVEIKKQYALVKKIGDTNPGEGYFKINKHYTIKKIKRTPSEYSSLKLEYFYSKFLEVYKPFIISKSPIGTILQDKESWCQYSKKTQGDKGFYLSNSKNLGMRKPFTKETMMQLVKYAENIKLGIHNYKLCSLIKHLGGTSGGHYIAYVKRNDGWYEIDDKNVRVVDEKTVFKITQDGYIFFYLLER
jgi:hypothetical protein